MFRDKIRDGIARGGRVVLMLLVPVMAVVLVVVVVVVQVVAVAGWTKSSNSKTHSPCVGASR